MKTARARQAERGSGVCLGPKRKVVPPCQEDRIRCPSGSTTKGIVLRTGRKAATSTDTREE